MANKDLSLFYGVVINADSATHTVEVAPLSPLEGQRKQGIVLSSVLCNSLGVKQTFIPPTGSRVLCVGVDGLRCIVVGVVPDEDESGSQLSTFNNRTSLGSGDTLSDKARHANYGEQNTKITTYNNRRPVDVPTREYVLANDFGVLLGLFQQMATLKASELSQVQCHVFDDLVRIVSHNFEHLSCMGEWRCSHDGQRLNIEAGLTHSVKEAAGMVDRPGVEPEATFTAGEATHNDATMVYNVDERLKALERLKLFVGHLGDFVNLFLVLPANQQRKLNGEPASAADKGLLQVKANLDGLLTIRSVKGVVIEKTNWIRVPTRVFREEDPKGNTETQDINNRADFTFDGSYDENDRVFLHYLQLRDYLAYINEEYNYERFNTLDKDFSVPVDYNAEERLSAVTFIDPTTGVAFKRSRSAFVLMPNGGISLIDAWSSAINMEGGNIYLQPSNDLVLQPGRNLIGKIGSNIQLAARREIDLSSTEGGYRLKTANSIYNYSDNSGIVLHSNGKLNADEPASPLDDAVEYVNGIVLKAPNSTLTSSSMYTYLKSTASSVVDAPDNQLRSEHTVKLQSDNLVNVVAKQVSIFGTGTIDVYSTGNALFIGDEATLIGKKGQTFGIADAGDLGKVPVQGVLDKEGEQADFFVEMNDYIDKLVANTVELTIPGFNTQEKFDALLFRFPSTDMLDAAEDWLPQTLAQQDEALQQGLYGLTPWVEQHINNSYPYPGADAAECFVTAAMNNLVRNNDEFVNKADELTAETTLNEPLNLFTEYTSK
ncbi:MAG: hypothetical protein EBU46_02925 [Nitrosomonadaceae bacterium]|nr:hypothetical protein [Nitrosomonadaceae bacterium]